MRKLSLLLAIFVCSIGAFAQNTTEGTLYAANRKGVELGACPLKNTRVQTEISGFLARVRVVQEFENNFNEPVEAVYTFPLSQNAAVDDMTMKIGERTIRGKILKKEEARQVYETAKTQGKTASLLDQQRPNIFTQSVANILPNEKIIIEISYVETLKYEDGNYEFVFPMTVGPRYIPASINKSDAQKISPPVAKERAGHDVSIEINLNAGVPVEAIRSNSHEITTINTNANSAKISLKNEKTIPNKDFVLRYDVTGKRIEDAVLMHRDERGGFFSMILQPPDRFATEDYTPKEIVFVLDTSGSMYGFPLDKAKEAMKLSLENLNPNDTFNLITFAGDTSVLFDEPVPATRANLDRAGEFLASHAGGGGTEMMKAIRAALNPSDSKAHLRIVCFMTDGYVGNEGEILQEIQKHSNARIFSFGIGNSVNRFLLDKMAEEGRGEVEYVALNDDGSLAAKRFHERVRSPLLTDISLDFGNLQVADVYPKRINDLFSAKPVVVHGRFTKGGNGVIKLKGKSFGRETVREIAVNFPENELNHDVLATLWARTRIDDLMSHDYAGVQNGNAKPEVKDTITNLGLEYRLLTQFTSFVAVEERIVTDGGQPRRIEVPVEMPEGVSREGVFGDETIILSKGRSVASSIQSLPVNSRNSKGLMEVTAGRRNDRKSKSNQIPNSMANVSKVELSKSFENELITIDGISSDSPIISQGIKANTLPKPERPQNAKAEGAVNVEVTLDTNGSVISAKAVSGDKAFYQTTEAAAKNARFEIPKLSVEIAKITGVIAYNFAKDKTVTVAPELQNVRVDIKPNKYHSSVKALVERLKNKQTTQAADEAKFVKNGKAEIIVRVKELKPETVVELKKLGFEVLTEMTSANAVVGRIAIEKITALAEFDQVTFVSPQNR